MKKKCVVLLVAFCIVAGMSIGAWAEKQPRMTASLSYLVKAKNELERATHDKGGHRVAAIRLIDEAMHEVRAGIAYDNRH